MTKMFDTERTRSVVFGFHNQVLDGAAMKGLISRFIDHFGMGYTSYILEQMKSLGFEQATVTSISLGIEDLLTIPSKRWLVQDVEQQNFGLDKHHRYGNIHAVERLRQSVEVWYATSEYLKKEMNPHFQMTNPYNPVHLMSFSGARGSASQVHQLIGMRGLMSNPQGQMVDFPIQSNLREGLSLTEYIISCYGARKGVIDTAIRTANAGYLTRRLVEVVQHIIVRRTDCGTIRGISVSPQREMTKRIWMQTLIGRVLADDIYVNSRCIAARNQDIGGQLVNQFITFQVKSIYIRTPLTCRSTSWICQLCYGRNPANQDLIELGEAVGIIAGQSIGEPGTQLTLRTFHTGGVFTGGTVKDIRATCNGTIKFNEDLVHPIRTRHGHPAFLCSINLYVTIENPYIIHHVNIPPKSLIFVQNDQYVESEQVIAEIRDGAPTLDLKEIVLKKISSESEGEMHWSTNFMLSKLKKWNVFKFSKAGHLWILVVDTCRSSRVLSFSFHKDQDQIINDSSMTKGQVRHPFSSSDPSGEKKGGVLDYDYSRSKEILLQDYWSHWNFLYPSIFQNLLYLLYPSIFQGNLHFLGKSRRNRFIIPLELQYFDPNRKTTKFKPCFRFGISMEIPIIRPFCISMEMPINGIFDRNIVFASCNDPRYRRKRNSLGILKYQTIIVKKKQKYQVKNPFHPKYREENLFPPKYQKIDPFSSSFSVIPTIPEEVHILPKSKSSLLMVQNNSLIGVDTELIGVDTEIARINTKEDLHFRKKSQVSGLVQVKNRNEEEIELQIFSGNIYFPFPGEKEKMNIDFPFPPFPEEKEKMMSSVPGEKERMISSACFRFPGTRKKDSQESKSEIYVQRIIPTTLTNTKKIDFVLVRPIMTYQRVNKTLFTTPFAQDLLQERDNVQLRVVNDALYGFGEQIPRIYYTYIPYIPLVRASVVLNWHNWDQKKKKKSKSKDEVHASIVEIRTKKIRTKGRLIRDFLRMELVQSPISHIFKRRDTAGLGFLCQNELDCTNINPFDSKAKIQPLIQHKEKETHGIGIVLNRNKECTSLTILSSFNSSQIGSFNASKYHNVTKEPIPKDLRIPIRNSLSLLGITVPKITNLYSSYHFRTHDQVLVNRYLLLRDIDYYFQQTSQVLQYCFMDENERIFHPDPHSNLIWNPLDWNWHFLHHDYCEESSPIRILGQFLCENVCLFQLGTQRKSGQVLIVHRNSLVIRSAKPYLVTSGTKVLGTYGKFIDKGDTLVTFLYEKPKSSDITQGLPKVEKLLEGRSIDWNWKNRMEAWQENLSRLLGKYWGFWIVTQLNIVQNRISLINKVQEVYRSQGVQIHNKHIEMIVRQLTSKVLILESSKGVALKRKTRYKSFQSLEKILKTIYFKKFRRRNSEKKKSSESLETILKRLILEESPESFQSFILELEYILGLEIEEIESFESPHKDLERIRDFIFDLERSIFEENPEIEESSEIVKRFLKFEDVLEESLSFEEKEEEEDIFKIKRSICEGSLQKGVYNIFSPGELIELSRAERASRVFDQTKKIFYRAIPLGMTRVSLNTQSFISEASFQETAKVLAKSALLGRIDWLKGLKPNVILAEMIPAGTGFPFQKLQKYVDCSKQQSTIHLEIKKNIWISKKTFGNQKKQNQKEQNQKEYLDFKNNKKEIKETFRKFKQFVQKKKQSL